MFFKIDTIKNFAIFTGKHLCWGILIIKLQVYRSTTFLKIDSNTDIFCGHCKTFKNSFLIQELRWLLLTVLPRHIKVSLGTSSLISHLHVISILIKTFTKRCTSNSSLSRDKTISSLLKLIGHVLEKH